MPMSPEDLFTYIQPYMYIDTYMHFIDLSISYLTDDYIITMHHQPEQGTIKNKKTKQNFVCILIVGTWYVTTTF